VKLTGAQVVEWLEAARGSLIKLIPQSSAPQKLDQCRVPTYNFDVIDGISYRIDVTQPTRYNADGEVVHKRRASY